MNGRLIEKRGALIEMKTLGYFIKLFMYIYSEKERETLDLHKRQRVKV